MSESPVHNVPLTDDALGYLFEVALVFLCGADPIAYTQLRATIQLVCRSWRRVALGNHNIWSLIFVDGNSSNFELGTLLQRSGVVPLELVLDLSEFDRTRSFVEEYFLHTSPFMHAAMSRCARLRVQCEALVDYEAVFRWLSSFRSTSVQHVTLDLYPPEDMTDAHHTSMPLLPFSLPSSLSVVHSLVLFGRLIRPTNLTKLVLDSVGHDIEIDAAQLTDGLQKCNGLTHLYLINIRTSDIPARAILENGQCRLPNVTHLYIVCSHQSCCYFVTTLLLPALTSLKFDGGANGLQCLLGDSHGYCNQGWDRVRVLSLVIHESAHTIACILPRFPGIRDLDLRAYETSDMGSVWEEVYLFTQHEPRPLCPELSMIHVGSALSQVDVQKILRTRPTGHFALKCGVSSYVQGVSGGLEVCRFAADTEDVVMDVCGSIIPSRLEFD